MRDSELRDAVVRFEEDLSALHRRYDAEHSAARARALGGYYDAWLQRLAGMNFEQLGLPGRVDYVLLVNRIRRDRAALDRERARWAEMAPWLPFANTILELHDRRRALEVPDAAAVGRSLARLAVEVDTLRQALASGRRPAPERAVAERTSQAVRSLSQTLKRWYEFHAGYDPVVTWWARKPYEDTYAALTRYRGLLEQRFAKSPETDDGLAAGPPIGREALLEELVFELIPYSPEEMLEVAERELAWCEARMREAAREMGFGENWRAALEEVKTRHVEPGQQPALVRDLAREAVDFVEGAGLVTVPELAKDVWRMEMMSPERQKVSPFFLGGETILVSFPTDGMSEADKQMSMRGNNVHFSRATVHHELIPGHHLQQFMTARYQPHRRAFGTPFWTEGWALYWEMLLWDLDFPRGPEDRIGMLFWRMHRAARILFSLEYHLGQMTPAQAVDLLVTRIGHEPANAIAEVRRSFNGHYPPLYQAAYMMGGLQFRALRRELVETGRMTDREFHDTVLLSGTMPVDLVRAVLTGQAPDRDHRPTWRFADPSVHQAASVVRETP